MESSENNHNESEKIRQKQERSTTPETDQINQFIERHLEGKLTREIVNEWLDGLPEEDREAVRGDLEAGIGEDIDNLPE